MITCPHCRHVMDDAPELAGQVVACPRCGGRMQLPGGPTIPRPPLPSAAGFAYHEPQRPAGGPPLGPPPDEANFSPAA